MFVNNPGLRDPRVTREAEVAVEAGFDVTVVACQNHDEDGPTRVLQRGVEFLRPKVGSSRLAGALRHVLGLRRTFSASPAAPREASPSADASATAAEKARPSLMRRLHGWGWGWRRTLVSLGQRIRLGLAVSADAYHAHDCDTLPIAWLCARLRGKPFIYDSHELWVDWKRMRGAGRWRLALWRALEATFCRQSALCVTVSEGLAEILRRELGLRRLAVVRNCARRPRALPTDTHLAGRAQVRAELGLGPDAPVTIYQGGLWPYRGLETLIRAATHVPKVSVLIVGPITPYAESLRALSIEHRAANVRFLGHQPEERRSALMGAADLGVVLIQDGGLSYRHSFANKNGEYFAHGLPVLASDLPEHRRVLMRVGAALLADPESASDVAAKIQAFFRMTKAQRRGLAALARSFVDRELNMDVQFRPVLDFYLALGRNR